jgi:hypothetical protein
MNITVKLPYFGVEVAPVSDPDDPFKEGKYPNLLTQGEFE